MPTPYQLDFFEALQEYFDLNVVYFTSRESDRQWQLPLTGRGYSATVLKNNRLAIYVQRRIPSFHFSWQIISVLKRDESDLVVINGTYWSPNVLLALYLSSIRGKKVSFWGEPVFRSGRLKFLIKRLLLWPVRHYTDFLLAIGKNAEEGYKLYGYSKPIYNIPYNINIDLFRRENLNPALCNELTNNYKSNGETILISSGALVHRKGMDTIIKSFLQLDAKDNARLLIIGDGQDKDQLVRLTEGNSRIHFLGFQEKEKIPYLFNLADIFVFASRYDGWALVINEAVASNLAILSSKSVGAAVDKLKDNYNALLIDAEDVDGFYVAMKKLIRDQKLRQAMVDANNKTIKEELSSQYNAKRLYEIYRRAE